MGDTVMRPKLIFISGPPGFSKSEVASRLYVKLAECAWLDGDDVWRIHPFRVDAETVAVAERNIISVLGNFLSSGRSHVILTWVLHRQTIIDRILWGLDGIPFDVAVFTLVCDEETLVARWRKSHPGGDTTELPLQRLRECSALSSTQVDTTGLDPDQVAERIYQMMEASEVGTRTAELSN